MGPVRKKLAPVISMRCSVSRGEYVEEASNEIEESSAASDNVLVKLVNKIIIDAYKMGVSDIHVEPYSGKEKTQIRFRKDGSLIALYRDSGQLPESIGDAD
jgi:type II secretory ATPase GspE/PulE/Tfp pilus assembly ATPase PilB-like protein